jgi:hypothetical protein
MSVALVAVLVGLAYAGIFILTLSLCMAAADGDRAAKLLYSGGEMLYPRAEICDQDDA